MKGNDLQQYSIKIMLLAYYSSSVLSFVNGTLLLIQMLSNTNLLSWKRERMEEEMSPFFLPWPSYATKRENFWTNIKKRKWDLPGADSRKDDSCGMSLKDLWVDGMS